MVLPFSSRAGNVGSIPANSDAQYVPSFLRWRFDIKLSPLCMVLSIGNMENTPSQALSILVFNFNIYMYMYIYIFIHILKIQSFFCQNCFAVKNAHRSTLQFAIAAIFNSHFSIAKSIYDRCTLFYE